MLQEQHMMRDKIQSPVITKNNGSTTGNSFHLSQLSVPERKQSSSISASTLRYFAELCYSNIAFSKVTPLCTAKEYLNKLIFSFSFFGFTNMIIRLSCQHPFTHGRFSQLISTQQEAVWQGRSPRLRKAPQKSCSQAQWGPGVTGNELDLARGRQCASQTGTARCHGWLTARTAASQHFKFSTQKVL